MAVGRVQNFKLLKHGLHDNGKIIATVPVARRDNVVCVVGILSEHLFEFVFEGGRFGKCSRVAQKFMQSRAYKAFGQKRGDHYLVPKTHRLQTLKSKLPIFKSLTCVESMDETRLTNVRGDSLYKMSMPCLISSM